MSSPITKPMLAASEVPELSTLCYPLIASPKLDGIRCLKVGGKILSRSLKPIPNLHVRRVLEELAPEGIDGELMSGANFQGTTSAIMSPGGEPDFYLGAFDICTTDLREPYQWRLVKLQAAVFALSQQPFIRVVPYKSIDNERELLIYEEDCLAEGFEGVMLRSFDGPYKCGRATLKEATLLKLKRFVDSEAVIIGVEEMMHNENSAETNELGRTKRSTKKAGMIPAAMLGAFIVRDMYSDIEFSIGTGEGLTPALRKQLWDERATLPGRIVKYKSQPHGVKVKPRIPSWQGFRDACDMS